MRWTYELARDYIENLGYKLLSNCLEKCKDRIIIKDLDGYYYYPRLNDLVNNRKPAKFHKSNPYTIQNIKIWCKLNNKDFELISDKYENSNLNLAWQCNKENCKEIFNATWENIKQNKGCSYCAGKKVGLSNCLATKNPELAKQWHPTKNGDLTPYDVTCGSGKNVWWQCSKNPKHEWNTDIDSRVYNNNGCPYCCGQLPSDDYNLLFYYPELCDEWDYIKNKKNPEEYTPKSGQKVWWKCKKCNYEWESHIWSRTGLNCGCPACNKSRGEEQIKMFLEDKSINYTYQKMFYGCKNIFSLRFDFYLPLFNLCIEYQGIQHYKIIKYFGGEKVFNNCQVRDKIKRDYCHVNNIKLLEIPYWDFDNIEEILEKELNL